MRKIVPYIAFFCLTGFTAMSGIPVVAGGCSSHLNKKVEVECPEDDTKCKTEKARKFELNKNIRS